MIYDPCYYLEGHRLKILNPQKIVKQNSGTFSTNKS